VTVDGRPTPTRRWSAGLAWALWAVAMLGMATLLWFDHLLRQAGRADLVQVNVSALSWLLALVSAPTVGAVLATRRPRHPVGWLLLGLGASIGLSGFVDGYAPYGLLARPGSLPAARWAAISSPAVTVAGIACLGYVLLLTPTGLLPSPRWRWWARVTAAAPVVFVVAVTLQPEPLDPAYRWVKNPLGLQALQLPLAITDVVASGITVLGVVVGALSLVVRFRRARGTQRQQLRWVALAAVLASVAILVVLAGMAVGSDVLIIWAAGVSFAVLPPAIGAAILRYRLYDLDRIISRTLAYGLLTVLLGGGYAAVVLGLGQLLGGRQSSLVVAGATLAVAAVFQPARRRVQELVDRRFNRRRYDAAETIQAFSAQLHQQVDPTTLTAELLAVADRTVEPTMVSLWLRPPMERSARSIH
jgi:hypothetical protein